MKFNQVLVVVGVLASALAQAQHPVNAAEARSLAQAKYGGRVIGSKDQGQYIDVTLQDGNTIRDVFFNRHTGRIDHERHFQKQQTRRTVKHTTRKTPLHIRNGDPFFQKKSSRKPTHVFHQPTKRRDDNDRDDVVRRALNQGKHKDNGKHLGQLKSGNNGKHLGQIKNGNKGNNGNKGKHKGDNDNDDKGKGKEHGHGR